MAEERETVNSERTFDLLCAKYFEYSARYCLSAEDRKELIDEFKKQLDGLDVVELYEKMSPLGIKFKVGKGMPSEKAE